MKGSWQRDWGNETKSCSWRRREWHRSQGRRKDSKRNERENGKTWGGGVTDRYRETTKAADPGRIKCCLFIYIQFVLLPPSPTAAFYLYLAQQSQGRFYCLFCSGGFFSLSLTAASHLAPFTLQGGIQLPTLEKVRFRHNFWLNVARIDLCYVQKPDPESGHR